MAPVEGVRQQVPERHPEDERALQKPGEQATDGWNGDRSANLIGLRRAAGEHEYEHDRDYRSGRCRLSGLHFSLPTLGRHPRRLAGCEDIMP